MTLPSGGALSLLDIYNEAQISASSPWYNKGYSLGAYRGVQWWKDDTSTGTFPSGAISVNDFYSKRSTSPVAPGSQTFTSNGTFTVPIYSVLTVTIRGASGGGAGQSGNAGSGSSGGNGTASSFGSYGTGDYGRGGSNSGAAGAAGSGSDGTPAGGNGWGPGGAGGKTVLTLTNPISGGSGPAVGASVAVTVGTKGNGGGGGAYWISFPTVAGALPGGNNGSDGSVVVSWS